MILTKRMSQFKSCSEYNCSYNYKVIERSKIEYILDNLDEKDIKANVVSDAMLFSNTRGCVYAELDIRTGEIEYNFYINDFLPSRPDLIVVLLKCPTSVGDNLEEFDIDFRYLFDEKILYEVNELLKSEGLLDEEDLKSENIYFEQCYQDTLAKVLENNGIDMNDEINQEWINILSDYAYLEDDFEEQLDRIYTDFEEDEEDFDEYDY